MFPCVKGLYLFYCRKINMKIALVFRGENVRTQKEGRNDCNALMCIDNWKTTLLDDLREKGHLVDVFFITYESEIIESLRNSVVQPKEILLHPKISQTENFKNVVAFMDKKKGLYDRFVILRCDFAYRYKITDWPKWKSGGIILVNKDFTWPSTRLYSDIMFLVDSYMLLDFKIAFHNDKYRNTLHHIGRYLEYSKTPFSVMYDKPYLFSNHPLHALVSVEGLPNLEHPHVPDSVV